MTQQIQKEELAALQERLSDSTPEQLLQWASTQYQGRLVFATSMGMEDQVITDMIARQELCIDLFTLDTGRLFQETYDLIERTESHYGIRIRVMFPDAAEVEEMVAEDGINLFRKSVANRRKCCRIRKLHPLKRALSGADLWICGLRREQSEARSDMKVLEWDEGNGLLKLSPIIDWSDTNVRRYVDAHDVPYNPLHDRGFLSIGCAGCSRAVRPGECFRAGRWWWEEEEHKECGLHWVDGKLVRPAQGREEESP